MQPGMEFRLSKFPVLHTYVRTMLEQYTHDLGRPIVSYRFVQWGPAVLILRTYVRAMLIRKTSKKLKGLTRLNAA